MFRNFLYCEVRNFFIQLMMKNVLNETTLNSVIALKFLCTVGLIFPFTLRTYKKFNCIVNNIVLGTLKSIKMIDLMLSVLTKNNNRKEHRKFLEKMNMFST